MIKRQFTFIIILVIFAISGDVYSQSLMPYDLRTAYSSNPIGIQAVNPVFSWKLKSVETGQKQTTYRILVASHPDRLTEGKADVWDSGMVESGETIGIPFDGRALQSSTRYYWTVTVVDRGGVNLVKSKPAWFETGLLSSEDWTASWISAIAKGDSKESLEYRAAPHFRKEFQSPADIQSARLYISGLGYYEAYLNGRRIGDQVLDPAVTRYDRSILYETYDVTELITSGSNAIGVVLGTGWYNFHARVAWGFDKAPWRDQPVLKAQLEILYSNGDKSTIHTDSSWKVNTGPTVFDGIHNGETYDARLENKGWTSAGTDTRNWKNAVEVGGPAGDLKPQLIPPIRHIRTLQPQSVTNPAPGKYIYDFGENIAGRIRIQVSGPRGEEIVIRHGERLYKDGTLDQEELSRFVFSGETQTSRIILGAEQPLEWSPSFSYHGFQYAEVNIPKGVTVQGLEAEVLHTDLETVGSFSCSDTLLNRIHRAMKQSYLSNFHGYPTDCPHREKIGWSGDAHLVAEGGLYNFDAVTAYMKWMDDFTDEQRPSGQVPGIIPSSGWGYAKGRAGNTYRERGYGPQWEGAFVLIPWQLYLHTGDRGILKRYYEPVKKYVLYLEKYAEEDLTLAFGIDDHKALDPTEPAILASGYFYSLTCILEKMAALLGQEEDRLYFSNLSKGIKKGYRDRFYSEENKSWGNGNQTSLAGTVYHGLCDTVEARHIVDQLLQDLEEKEYHLETGVVGTKYMLEVLTRFGHADVVYRMASRRTFPSWGYWMEQGATTLWQNWDGSQSRNHVMFGSIDDWFYKALAGIRPDENHPGFEKVIIHPAFIDGIDEVQGSYQSCRGLIKSEWEKLENSINLRVAIPANTTGKVILPFKASKLREVKIGNTKFWENGQSVEKKISGIKNLTITSNEMILDVYSGDHHFEINVMQEK